jgi:peptidoglycan/LPS O-acetylase OafA/YrhL
MTQPVRHPYRADLDGMRAIAVGLVVVFHFQLAPIGQAGFMGVDMFFVLSGFLITRIIMAEVEAGTFRLGAFYIARIRRLYPAMLCVLVAYLVVAWFLFLPNQLRELSIEAALSQLYVINVYFWREVNYFGLQAKNVPLLHMWSLALEEQFYIFYPLFLMALYRFARGWLMPVLVLTVVVSFALGWFGSTWKPQATFYLLPTRAWELGAGGILAVVLARHTIPAQLCRLAGPVGLALIVGMLVLHRPDTLFPGWFAVLPVLGTVALIVAGSGGATWTSRALALPPLVWIGRISYPLYLVHWPVIIVQAELLPDVTWGWRAAGLALSGVLSWLILVCVETPVRRGRILARPRALLGSAGVLTAVLLGISAWGYTSQGAPARFSPDVLALLDYRRDVAGALKPCDWPGPACPLGPDGTAQIALVGDSHAWAFATGVDTWLRDINTSGALHFASGCMPVPGTGDPRCAEFAETAIAEISADPDITTVLLASIWRQPYDGAGLVVGGQFLSGQDAYDGFASALETTVLRLRAAGKDVVIIEPFYAAPHKVPQTMARNLAFGRDWPVDVALTDHRTHFARADAAFERAADAGAYRVSLIDELCASGICPGQIDGAPVFLDNNHVRKGMSAHIAEALSAHVPQAVLQ